MAQFRQSGTDRVAVRIHHDLPAADHPIPHRPSSRPRRLTSKPRRRPSAVAVAASLALVVLIIVFASRRLSSLNDSRRDADDGRDDQKIGSVFRSRSAYWKELRFGHGSGKSGGDSRFWDKDDRRRDDDYGEQDSPKEQNSTRRDQIFESQDGENDHIVVGDRIEDSDGTRKTSEVEDNLLHEDEQSHKKEYQPLHDEISTDLSDEDYDDGIDTEDEHDEVPHDDSEHASEEANADGTEKVAFLDKVENESAAIAGQKKKPLGGGAVTIRTSSSEKKASAKRKGKRHKFPSPSCEIKFMNSTAQIVEPLESKKFARFSLQYTETEERPDGLKNWEPRFAGHQTLEEREESFYAHDQNINCGFVKGPEGYPSTGFDIAEDDMKFMSSCHVAVSSCIFGNSDRLRTPFSKTITRFSRKNVCFIMFVDQVTLNTLLSEGQNMDNMGFIGLWKIIVVKNLPYDDMRRVGKIPKFLSHRFFTSARYSIWLDSKLRLQSDPYLILEYFLWRRGYEFAISNHYDRHCVWDEVAQNKKLNKYNHTIIDQQFEFYQSDGLKRFDPSAPNNLLPSYVPEGSFIVRAHTPMSNLFSCLWFNEVDRFTSRDQLSFAYTFLKLRRTNPEKVFHLNMFKDCERRAMTKLFHHRTEERHNIATE